MQFIIEQMKTVAIEPACHHIVEQAAALFKKIYIYTSFLSEMNAQ
jgi:hypothetical protein